MSNLQLRNFIFMLIVLLPISSHGNPFPTNNKISFSAGILTGAPAGAVASKAFANAEQQNFNHYQALTTPAPTPPPIQHVKTIYNGAIMPNGCFEQTLQEPDPHVVGKFIETVQLVCPPPAVLKVTPHAIQIPVQPIVVPEQVPEPVPEPVSAPLQPVPLPVQPVQFPVQPVQYPALATHQIYQQALANQYPKIQPQNVISRSISLTPIAVPQEHPEPTPSAVSQQNTNVPQTIPQQQPGIIPQSLMQQTKNSFASIFQQDSVITHPNNNMESQQSPITTPQITPQQQPGVTSQTKTQQQLGVAPQSTTQQQLGVAPQSTTQQQLEVTDKTTAQNQPRETTQTTPQQQPGINRSTVPQPQQHAEIIHPALPQQNAQQTTIHVIPQQITIHATSQPPQVQPSITPVETANVFEISKKTVYYTNTSPNTKSFAYSSHRAQVFLVLVFTVFLTFLMF